jgi:hypothetical protein
MHLDKIRIRNRKKIKFELASRYYIVNSRKDLTLVLLRVGNFYADFSRTK